MTEVDHEMSIGQVAALTGTTIRTVRYYEATGVLKPASRSGGGHRRFTPDQVVRLRRALTLREVGVPLDSVAAVLDGDPTSLTDVLARHRAHLEAQMTTLQDAIQSIEALAQAALGKETDSETSLHLIDRITMSIALTRIYTRAGDDGLTALGTNERIPKTHDRIEAIGAVDELSAAIGIAIQECGNEDVQAVLWRIQNELFDLGADLAVPGGTPESADRLRVDSDYTLRLEGDCDRFNAELSPLRSFVLPGTSRESNALHFARAVCRRAERRIWQLDDASDSVRAYLNRLSDLLFILARTGEGEGEEKLWEPGRTR